MSTTTTTTEISSNSNSSCRLLVCLKSIPFHDQRVFRNQLGHIELLRLSACCRSLRNSIRNDRLLWQELYHRDFLSGAYYVKEMEFVLWCIRTDISNPCTSDKRADLLENVDWYNTYRRRVSTENNWRYGRCNTTRIDMGRYEDGVRYHTSATSNNLVIITHSHSNKPGLQSYYALELLPHSNLRSSNSIECESTFPTLPNVVSLDNGTNARYKFVPGDHYIAVFPDKFEYDTDYNVKILTRKHGGVITTFDVPARYEVKKIKGKWALLVRQLEETIDDILIFKDEVMVFDIENSIMCPGNIGNTWNATRFYKTNNNTAIVYTARLVDDDYTDRIEWALYQFSSNNPVVQLRNGWFELPYEILPDRLEFAFNSPDSHMILQLVRDEEDYSFIIHDAALGGQCNTPENLNTLSDDCLPIPVLQLGFKCNYLKGIPEEVWTDFTCSDDQILRFPGAESYHHIIGSLYLITPQDSKDPMSLVDINTKEIIRKPKTTIPGPNIKVYTMVGMVYSGYGRSTLVMQEYGEL